MLLKGKWVVLRLGSWFGKDRGQLDKTATPKMVVPQNFDSPEHSNSSEYAGLMLALSNVLEYTSEASYLQGNKGFLEGLPPTFIPGCHDNN